MRKYLLLSWTSFIERLLLSRKVRGVNSYSLCTIRPPHNFHLEILKLATENAINCLSFQRGRTGVVKNVKTVG